MATGGVDKISQSLQDLVNSLSDQVEELRTWIKCRELECANTEDLRSLHTQICTLEGSVTKFDETITKEETTLEYAQRLLDALQLHNGRIEHMRNNLPRHLPTLNKQQQQFQSLSYMQQENISQSENKQDNSSRFGYRSSLTAPTTSAAVVSESKTKHKKTVNQTRSVKSNASDDSNGGGGGGKRRRRGADIPTVQPIGKDEFDATPKYIRGRLNITRVNASIEAFNGELQKKYSLLLTHNTTKLSSKQLETIERYHKSENKDTKGCYWLGGYDLKSSNAISGDNTGKAIMQVLRHLKRLRLAGGKESKYIVCTDSF